MKNLIFKIAVLTGTVAAFASCSDTWLMYDTSQKDKLYFKYENYPSLDQYLSTDFSFALLDESVKEVKKTVTVTLLGMPADRDRTFEVRAIHDTTSNYTTGGVQRELYAARGVIRGGVVNGPYLERPVAVCRHSQQGHGYGLLDLFHRFVEQGERKVGREILVQTRIVLVFEIEFVLLRRVVHQPRVGTGGECRDGSGQDGYFENEVFHKSCVIVCNCPLRSAGWASCRSRRRFPRNCLPVSRCPAAIVSC